VPNHHLGPWKTLEVEDAAEIFAPATFRWWISGGRALDLHLGRTWRHHEDTDVSVARRDVPALRSCLPTWDIHVAAAGRLSPWRGQEVSAALHENNLWCRPTPNAAWALDITVSEGDTSDWVLRRDPRVRFPWSVAVLRSTGGVPYLAPELQLLFKSKEARDKDDMDAHTVIPELEWHRREFLRQHLSADHPWQQLLSD
jgi:hypothetical protein